MIRLIFIVIAFLMMIGAVIGGLYFWGIDPLAKLNVMLGQVPADPNQPQEPAVAAPSYVDFGILIVPVIQDRQVKKQAEMILRLRVPYDKKEKVAQQLPRLQAAFLSEMMAFLPNRLRDTNTLDTMAVSDRLTKVAGKVLGSGYVEDVVIEQASVK